MMSGMASAPAMDGHSPEIVHELIKYYAQNLPHQNAVACALRDARKNWRVEFPRGAYPAHLRKKPKSRAAKKNKYVEEIL